MSETGWIGKSVKRVEDARLLTGRGTFIDDHPPVANLRHAAIVRSPLAHAKIRGYDLSAALALPGVVGVITGKDVARQTKPFAVGVTAPIHYYCAATDRVRFVGEPVAVVVAKSRYIAEDAADLVEVDYEPLPVVVDPERALEADAPVLHEAVGSNLAGNRPRVSRGGRRRQRALQLPEVRIDADRDVRRHRPMGPARRRVHRVVELHGTLHHAPADGAGPRSAGEQASLHRAGGHRGLVRHQVVDLPVHRPDRARGETARGAGEVDRGPPRASAGVVERDRSRRVP